MSGIALASGYQQRRRPAPQHVEFVGRHVGEHGAVVFEVWHIAPKLAAAILEHTHNRPLRVTREKKYARTMKRGAWELNYEWIALDDNECCCEGQHRLAACVRSGVPFRALVITNYPRALFPTIGVVLPRGGADTLALLDTPQYVTAAAALAYVYRAENGMTLYASGDGSRPENDEVANLIERHPGIVDSARMARRCSRVFPSPSMMAYLHYEFAKRDREAADAFVLRLADGVGLRASDPVYVLRERLLDNKRDKAKLQNKHVMAITIKAWNYVRAGRRAPKFLRWSDGAGEAFPEIQ